MPYIKFSADEALMEEIRDFYEAPSYPNKKNPYLVFQVKTLDNVQVTCYKSKEIYTLMFSGDRNKIIDEALIFIDNPVVIDEKTINKDYLDNDYIIKENKYSSLKVDALKDDELTFKLDNTNIKLQGYNVAIANTTAEFNYFIIPNKEGQTIIDFTLLSKETNEERHLKYQVTVNEDLAVSYEKIN